MKKLLKIGVVASLLAFMFAGCDNMNGKEDPTANLTADGNYISVEDDAKGIKITIADGIKFKEYGGSTITVIGCPLKISITYEDIQNGRREYIFPFAEKDKEYVVELWGPVSLDGGINYKDISEKVKCKAGGGVDYKNYIDTNPIKNSQLDVVYDESKGTFNGTLRLDGTSIIKDAGVFKTAEIGYAIVLGERDWSHTTWLTGADSVNLLSLAASVNSYTSWGGNPSLGDWAQYNYKYAAYITPGFIIKEYPDTRFEMDAIWSSQKIYEPAEKPITQEEAFENAVKNIKTFIDSETALKTAIADTVAEYEAFFRSPNSRAATTSGDTVKQINDFIYAVFEQYTGLMNKFKTSENPIPDFKVNFDKTIDVGKLGSKDWKNTVVDVAKYVTKLSGDEYEGYRIESDINQSFYNMQRNLGFNDQNELFDFIDSAIAFQKVYFKAKADVNFEAAKLQNGSTDSVGSAALDANIKLSALDVNKIIACSAGVSSVDLPVKAVALDLSGNLALAATYADIAAVMAADEEISIPDLSNLNYNLGYKANIETALCTNKGLGGIVGIDAAYAMDMQTAMNLIMAMESNAKMSPQQIMALLEPALTLKVYATNGSRETFSKNYNLSELYSMIMEIAD